MARSPLAPSRRHLAWPLLLVAAGLAATAAVAWRAQTVAQESRATAQRLVVEHAGFAAWSFRRDAEEALGEAVWMVVNPILHRHPHELDRFPQAGHLPLYLTQSIEECGCEVPWRPQSYFAFVLGSDTLGTAGERAGGEILRWVTDTLTAHLRTPGELRGRSGIIAGRPGAAAFLLGYGLMPMTRGDTIVYAFTFDPRSIAPLFERAFAEASLLPATVTRGRVNDSILAVRVLGPGGAQFYQSEGWDSTYAADDVLRPAAAGLSIQTALRPLLVNDILAGELPPERLPLAVVGLLLLAAATLVVGVRQLRREEELGRARADFVASVSHELRTPLAQIRLFLETLRLGRFRTDEQREWLLGHLDRETLRLSTLVENVLAFARRDAGSERSGAGEPADLMREVSDAVRAFAPLAAARHVTIVVEPAEQLGARLDRTAFRQLLLNLFDNAVKYGPPGGTIRVVTAPAGSMVRLTVSDDGPGIAPEERERVWKPFVRGGAQAVQAIGGSGLGLALVRDIAEGMGGSARFAEPDPDGLRTGTSVVIELPAAPIPAAQEPAAPTPERVAV